MIIMHIYGTEKASLGVVSASRAGVIVVNCAVRGEARRDDGEEINRYADNNENEIKAYNEVMA